MKNRVPRKIKKGLKKVLSARFPLWRPKDFHIQSIRKSGPQDLNTLIFKRPIFKGFIADSYYH